MGSTGPDNEKRGGKSQVTDKHKGSAPWAQEIVGSETMGAIARLMQVVGMPVVIALGGWLGVTIDSMKQSITRLETQMIERTADRYTSKDAQRDFSGVSFRLDNADRRIDQINGRLQAIEAFTRMPK